MEWVIHPDVVIDAPDRDAVLCADRRRHVRIDLPRNDRTPTSAPLATPVALGYNANMRVLVILLLVGACGGDDTYHGPPTCSGTGCACSGSGCSCSSSDCTQMCESNCSLACSSSGSCSSQCGANCMATCSSVDRCDLTVGDGSTVQCTSSHCTVMCLGSCLVQCTSSPCEVTCNGAAATSCGAGGAFVCGRACPG